MTAPSSVRTCYRHPDRVAGISCQRCDRPICPACMNQASVGFHCPDCAKAGKQKVLQGAASWTIRPLVTQILIGINVLAYLAMTVTTSTTPFTRGGLGMEYIYGERGLFADGGLYGQLVPEEPWRLITGGFLHAPLPYGLLHIGFNMLVLMRLGQMLEPALGRSRFTALYFAGLAGGSLGVVILSPQDLTIGASGAVFGLMGGAVMVARASNIDLWRSGLVQLIGINLLITLAGSSFISVGGHVGGLIAGLVGGAVVTMTPRYLGKQGVAASAALTGALAVATLVVAYVLMVDEFGHVFSP